MIIPICFASKAIVHGTIKVLLCNFMIARNGFKSEGMSVGIFLTPISDRRAGREHHAGCKSKRKLGRGIVKPSGLLEGGAGQLPLFCV